MILFPAIDIKDGKVVRLTQGDYQQVTQYAEDPVAQAREWAEQGTEWLHVVDLDAAKAGEPVNSQLIQTMAEQTGLKVQVGGGIRSVAMAQTYLSNGVARVVVGTRAVQHPQFLAELGERFPGQVALGLDTKADKIAVQGWTETTEQTVADFLAQAPLDGVACLIFTDIARDGMLQGPNVEALEQVLACSPIPVIASGGIASLEDLKILRELNHPKLLGAITGKALYEGKFTLKAALQCVKGQI